MPGPSGITTETETGADATGGMVRIGLVVRSRPL